MQLHKHSNPPCHGLVQYSKDGHFGKN